MAFTPLNAVNSFLAVARRRSFAAAARDLGVSASALSQSVQQLEARVGIALLTRTSRSVALTEAGQRLLENAGPAVEQALDALKTISARPGEVTGRLRLNAPSAAVPLILKRLIPTFIDRFPRVDLDIQVDNRFVNIVSEGFDAGIRLIEAIDQDMVQVRLTEPCRVVVAGAPSYLKRKGVPETPTDLLKHDCLCFRRTPNDEPWPWEFERGRKTWRVPVRGPVTVSDPELLHALALGGRGLLYTLDAVIATHLARNRLRLVLERYAPSVPGLFLYFPNRAQVSPALRAFVNVAREVAKATHQTAA